MNNELVPLKVKENKKRYKIKFENINNRSLKDLLDKNVKYSIIDVTFPINNRVNEIFNSEFLKCICRK